jgi:hypothetical protein
MIPSAFESLVGVFGEGARASQVLELCKDGVLFVEDGNHGENRPLKHEFAATGVPFVRPDDLNDGNVDFVACDKINDQAVRRVRKGKGGAGDILFTHRATVGRMARVRDGAPAFIANPGVTVWRSLDKGILRWPASSEQRFASDRWIFCRLLTWLPLGGVAQ